MLFTSSFTPPLPPPPPALPPPPLPAFISHHSHARVIEQSYLKSACVMEVVFCGRLIFWSSFGSLLDQSFPEGIIRPYEGTSLTIGNRPISVFQSVTVFRLIFATRVRP